MALYPQLIIDALKNVRYPGTGQDIISAGMVADDIRIDGRKVSFSLITEKAHDPFIKSVVKMAEQAILTYAGNDIDIKGNISVKSKQAPRTALPELLPGVQNIIAVASGKGGVGKSTDAPTLPWHWPKKDIKSDCWMPIFSDLPYQRCWAWKMRGR